jgi:hypothetical protein
VGEELAVSLSSLRNVVHIVSGVKQKKSIQLKFFMHQKKSFILLEAHDQMRSHLLAELLILDKLFELHALRQRKWRIFNSTACIRLYG